MRFFPSPAAGGLPAVCLVALLGLAASASQAQLFKEPALQALYASDRHEALAQAGLQRLAARADDAQAVLAVATAALVMNDGRRREQAIARAEACLQQAPQVTECHYALGTVLGALAISQGMLAAARSAGRVKEALTEAVRLDPAWYPARSAAVEFFMLAPGVMGGSTRRAEELARAAARPEQTRALQARIALGEDQIDKALALLQDAPTGGDPALADDLANWQAQAGFSLLQSGQPARARPVFERLLHDQPGRAVAAFGLGRVAQEAGQHADAVKLFEQGLRGQGAQQLPGLHYRLGLSLQALGQAEAARAALQRFVADGRASGKALDDARKRLAQLSPAAG